MNDSANSATGFAWRRLSSRISERSRTRPRTARLERPNGSVRRLAFHPDGRRLAVAGWYAVDLWDVEEREFLRSFACENPAWEARFVDDGDRLAERRLARQPLAVIDDERARF